MACKSFKWNELNPDNHGYFCVSSATGYIAVSVHNNEGKDPYGFKVYLDIYEPSEGGWVQMGVRSGKSSTSGAHVSFDPNIASSRTYRVRLDARPEMGGFWVTSASFSHAG